MTTYVRDGVEGFLGAAFVVLAPAIGHGADGALTAHGRAAVKAFFATTPGLLEVAAPGAVSQPILTAHLESIVIGLLSTILDASCWQSVRQQIRVFVSGRNRKVMIQFMGGPTKISQGKTHYFLSHIYIKASMYC